MTDCTMCGGSRLRMGGWMGPTPAAPYPEPCVCSPDLTPRERQVLQTQWLLDNQHRDDVKEVLSRMAVFNAQKYKLVLSLPHMRDISPSGLHGFPVPMSTIADADMVIGTGNIVLKDRHGAAGYVLSDNEMRRIRDSAKDFRQIR